MKAITGKELAALLQKEGWTLLRIQGSHHIYGKTGMKARISVPVHGGKTLKTGLARHLLKLAEIDPEKPE